MKKELLQQRIAERIEKEAIHTVKNTVGKSIPYMIHEVKLPEELRKVNMEEL